MNAEEFFKRIIECEDEKVLKDKFALTGNFTIFFSGESNQLFNELMRKEYNVFRKDILIAQDKETLLYFTQNNIEGGLRLGGYLVLFEDSEMNANRTEIEELRRQLIQKYNFSVGIVGRGPYLLPSKRRDTLLDIKEICREKEIPFCIPSPAKLQKTGEDTYYYDLSQIVYYEPKEDLK